MLTAIAAAFSGGIILNLMPCVFPVVSLKAISLVHNHHNLRQARTEGLAFMGGVLVTMMILAAILLLARAGGHAVGWGFQLQSPLVIGILALVMLSAALNMLGVFEPGLTAQRAGQIGTGRQGSAGAALTGALAIVVATPCSAPFMASAIGYAFTQSAAVSMLIFVALALGFAAPFTLLSWFPLAGRLLPKPGRWMVTLKQALAFPMLGATGWLIWVLESQAGSAALARILAACVVTGMAAWLCGLAQQRQIQGQRHRGLQIASIIAVALLIPMLATLKATSMPTDVAQATTPPAQIAWSAQNVEAIKGQGKPIFVNFTAAWCITCQVNDRTSLSTAAVQAAMARTDTIYMVADATRYNPEVQQALSDFGRGGLPLYVVYPANGGKPEVLPQVLTPQMVITALNHAVSAAKKID